ncbi:hypothetical protein [Leucobacter japonicus]|uniref:hypothetical protein n=1 Tax=Leucobacter japonicus TaxID=1461259 RepID=UPI0006A77FA1|nr:hypothetical protein [Leucobacter japonicus]
MTRPAIPDSAAETDRTAPSLSTPAPPTAAFERAVDRSRLGETFAGTPTSRRRWLSPLRAGVAALGIAILAFGGGFGTAYAVNAASAPPQPPAVQLEMPEGLMGSPGGSSTDS